MISVFASVTESTPIALALWSGIGRDSKLAQELGERGVLAPRAPGFLCRGVSASSLQAIIVQGPQTMRGATQMSAHVIRKDL